MKQFLLTFEPSKLSISGALYRQLLDGIWTSNRETEVKRFIKIHHDVLNNINAKRSKHKNDNERMVKLQSFAANEDLLRKRVSLIL